MNILELKNITKKFPEARDPAVYDFNLTVKRGEIVALLGESGCGKTTILRMIAGFELPTRGEIYINGEIVSGKGIFHEPQVRKVGIVFQDYALFPHKTVWENITFGLFHLSADLATNNAEKIIELSGLKGLEKRYPHQLSGGQKQRVALARAMAPEPKLILFDEPFSNIDSFRKNQMREDIRNIIKNTDATAVFVTHDTRDVLSIADKVSVIKEGKHMQTDTPDKIYNNPVNVYVANFFGKTNFIKAKISKEGFKTPLGIIKTTDQIPAHLNEVLLSIRPEEFTINPESQDCFCGNIVKERFMGDYKELTCKVENPDGEDTEIIIHVSPTLNCRQHKCYFKPNDGKINILRDE
ncbi:MAG: ABC transporter ATP-binding protein [Bacteroidetes bacterium]|nr:MAG: ABC transporter ATP-binding protein [Bacteroidota bacterium]